MKIVQRAIGGLLTGGAAYVAFFVFDAWGLSALEVAGAGDAPRWGAVAFFAAVGIAFGPKAVEAVLHV